MEDSLVSIITPVYNSEIFVKYAIESVLKQTYNNWELILVDDCSIDNSKEVINYYTYKDKRIKCIRMEKNSGVAMARNCGIENSKGRYLAFLDSDDVWREDKLKKHLEFMKENKCGFTFSAYEIIDENSNKLNKIIKVPRKIDYRGYIKNTIIGCLTVVVDRKATGDITMVPVQIEDFATWLQLLKKIDYAYGIQEPLAQYRIVKGSSSYNKMRASKGVWDIYRNVEKLSLLESILNFGSYGWNAVWKRISS